MGEAKRESADAIEATMSFAFPEFSEPNDLDAQRSWTAIFDSYDQRNDDAYYRVRICDGDLEAAPFMVQVGLYWAGDDWTLPSFGERLQQELHRVAVTGVTNTSYTGSMMNPGPR
jgi:hypothetical protein